MSSQEPSFQLSTTPFVSSGGLSCQESNPVCQSCHVTHINIGVTHGGLDMGTDWMSPHLVLPRKACHLMHSIVDSKSNCAFVVNGLTQYLSNPRDMHIQALKNIMQYNKGTLNYGIKYQIFENGQTLCGYFEID